MKVGYKKSVGVIFILTGLIYDCVYLLFVLMGEENSFTPITMGFIGILFGILFLTKPYFEYDEKSLKLFALLGFTVASYSFDSLSDLELERNKLLLRQGEQRKRINISVWMVDSKGWQTFVGKVTRKA